MKSSDFYFDLPESLIAQHPLLNRDESRLMVLDKNNGDILHKSFKDITELINEGDCLVLNDTRVIPARLIGEKEGTGGKIELLLLKRLNSTTWETLTKPGKRAKVNTRFTFGNGELKAKILAVNEDGNRVVEFKFNGIFEQILDQLGQMPLPPYIKESLEDKERYQTVYSKSIGSAAAPTAGLHFTKELLEKLKAKGVKIVFLTLHVGLGTFRPVKVENVEEHNMHSEYFELSLDGAKTINETKKAGKKVIAVGTTSCRTLETIGDENGFVGENSGWTNIFIYPGYNFKVVDSIITNFHLPESTLIMLVSAFAGKQNVLEAYKSAVENKYRFFSFGDAMFLS